MTTSWRRVYSVAWKECRHILRDPQTLAYTLMFPVIELFLLGYAIDMNVRHIRTAIVDYSGTQESRTFLRRFENSQDFDITAHCSSEEEMRELIVAGKARVGIMIPRNYSQRLLAGQQAQILVLIDGTLSSVAAEAINVGNALALRESLERALGGKALQLESRPQVLFNPDTRSANFFVPGLLIILCQMMVTTLSAGAIVREREVGTMEQLYMTPIGRWELILGKMAPYLLVTLLEFGLISLLMRCVFHVPIHGSYLLLLTLFVPFVLTMLGIGMWISTKAATREAAGQLAMGTVLPAVFLSGYVFPVESMPIYLQYVSQAIPTTWMVDVSRGVILRGAEMRHLGMHAAVLWLMAAGALTLGALQLRKQTV